MRGQLGAFALVLFIFVLASSHASGDPPFTVGGDPDVSAADFRVTTFASGLNSPYGMRQLSDGSLLVATNAPNPNAGSFFNSTGQLLRLVDLDSDGVADGEPQVLANNLPGRLTAIEQVGDLVLAISNPDNHATISVLRAGATTADAFTPVGTIEFNFPDGTWWHTVHGMTARPASPASSGAYDLFFNVGSQINEAATPANVTASATGLMTGTLNADSLYKVRVQDTGSSVGFSNLTQIAAGVRNSAGIAFHPVTHDLYFAENGIDDLQDGNEPLSADELNRITSSQIGASVPNFGFSENYIEYRTGNVIGGDGVQPLVAFQPIGDPDTGSESEGSVQIAMAPISFPGAVSNGVFVGFHGKFFEGGLLNEENPLLYYDLGTGKYFDFISNDEVNISHLDGLLSTSDSLFVSDLGNIGSSAATGAIYQIKSLTAPFLGNMDGNGVVDENDTHWIELALTRPSEFTDAFPSITDWQRRGDVNGDGAFNNLDLLPLPQLLAMQPVPEPGSAWLAGFALAGFGMLVRRRLQVDRKFPLVD